MNKLSLMVSKHKVKMVFLVFIACVILIALQGIYQGEKKFAIRERRAVEEVIKSFVTNRDKQIEISHDILSIYPWPKLGDCFIHDATAYKDKLKKKYTNGNYFMLVLYRSVNEFNRENPDCCETTTVNNSDNCFPGELDWVGDDGPYTCVFFRARIRYFDENHAYSETSNGLTTGVIVDKKGKVIAWY